MAWIEECTLECTRRKWHRISRARTTMMTGIFGGNNFLFFIPFRSSRVSSIRVNQFSLIIHLPFSKPCYVSSSTLWVGEKQERTRMLHRTYTMGIRLPRSNEKMREETKELKIEGLMARFDEIWIFPYEKPALAPTLPDSTSKITIKHGGEEEQHKTPREAKAKHHQAKTKTNNKRNKQSDSNNKNREFKSKKFKKLQLEDLNAWR